MITIIESKLKSFSIIFVGCAKDCLNATEGIRNEPYNCVCVGYC